MFWNNMLRKLPEMQTMPLERHQDSLVLPASLERSLWRGTPEDRHFPPAFTRQIQRIQHFLDGSFLLMTYPP